MIKSIILKEEVQIYQKNQFSFYFIHTEVKKLHEKSIQIQPLSFSFNNNKSLDYISIYENTSKQIDQYISNNDVQLNYSSDGLSNAIVCAYLIYKGFFMDDALIVMDFLYIDRPNVYYLSSLKRLEEIQSATNMNRSSIILSSDMDLEKTIQNSMVQSQILNFPIFSQRLIETQRNSQILPQEYQATSEIFNQQQISFISFGQQDFQNINEEPQINKIQSSIVLNKKQ